MIRRHPHVFGNGHADNADEVKQNWHRVKMKEKNHAAKKSVLDSVPTKLPALMRAYRISERAAGTGFDWNDISGVMQKVEEEWSELKFELAKINQTKEDQNKVALEFGDILFTLVNVARFIHIHPETALSVSIKKFEKRFKHMENLISVKGKNFESISQNEMNILWEEAKKLDKS
jgi:tetrapyrrole methylase family protein/MazG family protein